MVEAANDASICQNCGAPFITANGIEAFLALSDTLPRSYRITIQRERNRAIGDAITFLLVLDGRPVPLADGGSITVPTNKKRFELPVFITNNSKTSVEGVLTGIADGKDICITWGAERGSKTLGRIQATTNDTVSFQEKKIDG